MTIYRAYGQQNLARLSPLHWPPVTDKLGVAP